MKLYVEEDASQEVRDLVGKAAVVATSLVAYAEARAALARQAREGRLSASGLERARADFETDWDHLLKIPVTEQICRRAGDLAEKHRLRGFDGLHLASFVGLLEPGAERAVRFSSYDDALNRAARSEMCSA